MLSTLFRPNSHHSFARIAGCVRTFALREPPMPPLTNPTLRAIETAQHRGDLDNLTGAGKPLSQRSDMAVPVGLSSSQILGQKAEFEMRRAIYNHELSDISGLGEELPYKGTSVTGTTMNPSEGGGNMDVMKDYVAKEGKIVP